jgi:S-adenosylmethionine decarboxylase
VTDAPATGTEWIVEARGCAPEALRSTAAVRALFDAIVAELSLHPVAPPLVHPFPPPGGVTAVLVLAESHLTVHTFPETRYAALNLYLCRPRPACDFAAALRAHLGAERVEARAIVRGGLAGAPERP